MAEGTSAAGAQEPAIRLEGLGARYPGQSEPAVHDITLEVPKGEIAVLVGPSGCGKTTTLKLINRLIEPTAGRIYIEGQDVTDMNADRLRRRIGYVIQQIGLFPHMTIAQNIAVTPRLLGWARARVSERVDELLELVGMDPGDYRRRYPRELSGGQRQRVGVARALAADPPVMLMDEPFGAIDPITRERLQDEFLALQRELRKTVVFVTHDIAEAIKMGDRIAILRQGGTVAQYDTPGRILAAPVDRFVEEFVGAGSALRRLGLERVGEVEPAEWALAPAGAGTAELREAVRRADGRAVLLLDGDRRPVRWLRPGEPEGDERIPAADASAPATVGLDESLQDALDAMLTSEERLVVVVDGAGAYRGVLDFARVAAALGRTAGA